MGNLPYQKIVYSVKVAEKERQGETEIRRHRKFTQKLCDNLQINGKHLDNQQDIFLEVVKMYPDKQFIGSIVNGKVQFKTYEHIFQLAQQLGSGIINLDLAPTINEYNNLQMRLIGIFSKNREEWAVLDLSNALYKAVIVPIYETLGPQSISHVINHSGIQSCFCSEAGIKLLMETPDLGKLKNIISLDPLQEVLVNQIQQRGLKLFYYKEVLLAGEQKIHDFIKVKGDDVFTFSYTSGTTDIPKGAMISHKNLVCIQSGALDTSARVYHEDIYYSYLPLPHIFERFAFYTVMSVGGTVCFTSGDIRNIKSDLAIIRPTILCGVPRVFNRFYTAIQDAIANSHGLKKLMINLAIKQKLSNFRKLGTYTHQFWDRVVFEHMKSIVGGRVRFMMVGSAPTSASVMEFLKIAFCCPLLNGYGQTESIGGCIVTRAEDPNSEHVGGIMPGLEVKLIDVPEMDYLTNQKDEKGNLIVRGEVLLRGPQRFVGYYKDPVNTSEAIDSEGWCHTGDIGQLYQNGAVRIIDRRKNIFKLSQGEYIAPEKIENIYVRVQGVAEVFVYGDSFQNYLVGIIVPNKEVFLQIASENQITGSYEQLCKSEEMKGIMLNKLQTQGKKEGLFGFEQVTKLYIEPQSFLTIGCMTNTFKLQRFLAMKIFKEIIQQMYQDKKN